MKETVEAFIPILGVMIPILSIVLPIGVVFWAIYWHYRNKQLQYEERRLMIEKGIASPPVLLEGGRKRWSPEDYLRWGTIMVFLGIGFAIASVLLHAWWSEQPPLLGVAGAIVGLLGLGYLVYYFIAKDRKPAEPFGRA